MPTWITNKGFHYSFSNILHRLRPRLGSKPVQIRFNFDESCWFDFKDSDDLDINKLIGFSYGYHHKNSVRIGWRPSFQKPGKIELHFYNYNNGERTMEKFAVVDCLVDHEIKISFDDRLNYATFELLKDSQSICKASVYFILPKIKIGYWLWFYFGGNKTAPQKMKVMLNILDHYSM